jgi:hypothetical protein
MNEIRVSTVSAEEASRGVAELWADGELMATPTSTMAT